MTHRLTLVLVALLAVPALALPAERGLPLPEAPVRLVIPDARAFDDALGGGFGRAVQGELDRNDPVVAAWRQSRVGAKLEDQWETLSTDLPWTWKEIRRLRPRAVGVALLQVGALEALVVIDTPLAALPVELPEGTKRQHGGVTYSFVASGAGDHGAASSRRLGLAWARHDGLLLLATSARALGLGLDEMGAGREVGPFLPGLASLELDLNVLRTDRYFQREFPFPAGPESGRVRAALRWEGDRIVEVREGTGETPDAGVLFDTSSSAAAGWEPGADGLWEALRSGVLEPRTRLLDRPVPPRRPLPNTTASSGHRYLVDFTRPPTEEGPWDEGDVAAWRDLLSSRTATGWGWRVGRTGERAVAFAWPVGRHGELEELCRTTLRRRAGPVETSTVGPLTVMRVGPDLEALALRRDGPSVWIATAASLLDDTPVLRPADDVVRWGHVDLDVVRGLAGAWARAEGPAAPERVRPLSDRILGLLGWMPEVSSLTVERRRTESGWSESILFGTE